MIYDVAVIGAGITGSSLAFELSKYELNCVLLESENDVSMKTSKANSGIVHAGYDPLPNTKMARLNVEGNALIHELYPLLNFHFKEVGSLVLAFDEEGEKKVDELYSRGLENGVPGLKILTSNEEIRAIEPRVNLGINRALYAKTAGICSPWELTLALANTAVLNGVEFRGDFKVTDIEKVNDTFILKTGKGEVRARYVINCAGLHADEVYSLLLKRKSPFTITPVRGEYYLLDKDNSIQHVIFQTPTKSGKGVLVAPTVHGNVIVGPTATEDDKYRDYTGNTATGLSLVREQALKSVGDINFRTNIRNFTGVRATIAGFDDFYIEEDKEYRGFINFAGIKSPGITAAPAFGRELVRMLIADGEKLREKKDFKYYRLPKFFANLSLTEKRELIKRDPKYGQIICRCESVTEGEIIDAIHQPIPARTIDAVKRRTNAGMGRCQGGFCGPKVFEILKQELGLKFDEVYQDFTGSNVVVAMTKGDSE